MFQNQNQIRAAWGLGVACMSRVPTASHIIIDEKVDSGEPVHSCSSVGPERKFHAHAEFPQSS